MSRNGSGTYNLPAGNPVVTGNTISSSWANTTLSDIASALTGSIAADGQTTPTANLVMGTYAHTGVGNATARTMYASAGQVQDSVLTYLTSVAGTNAITASAPIVMTAYATGQTFRFIAAGASTGAVTININSIGLKSVVRTDGSALVSGDIASGAAVQIMYDGTNFQLLSDANGASEAFTNLSYTGTLTGGTGVVNLGSGQFYKDASGNVGIGTASPSTYGKLAVVGSDASALYSQVVNTNASGLALLQVQGTGAKQSYFWQASASYSTYHSLVANNAGIYASTNLSYEADGAFYQSWWTNSTERMRIDSSGNVCVGTSTALVSSAGRGNVTINGTDAVLAFGNSGTNSAYIFNNSGMLEFNAVGSRTMNFTVNGSERMRIDSSGNLLVGGTSSSPYANNFFYSNGSYWANIGHPSGTASGQSYILFGYNGGGIGSITQNGTTGVLYNIVSDQRLKENIVDAPSALDKIDSIKVRSFDFKSDGSHVDFGTIAQELYEVAPECVAKGDDSEEIETTWGVDTSALVPAMIKAIQELSAKVAELEAKVAK